MNEYINEKLGGIVTAIDERTGKPYYTDSTKHNEQFVGRVPANSDEFATVLDENGFEKISDGFERSWRQSFDAEQLHVVFYDGEQTETGDSDYTYVYAHVEIKPSVAPLSHLRNDSVNGAQGVKRMKKFLDENGLGYEPIRP